MKNEKTQKNTYLNIGRCKEDVIGAKVIMDDYGRKRFKIIAYERENCYDIYIQYHNGLSWQKSNKRRFFFEKGLSLGKLLQKAKDLDGEVANVIDYIDLSNL